MMAGLHHVSLAVADLDESIRTYRELLGREPSIRSEEDGTECAYFVLENSALRIVSPSGDSPTADGIRQRLQTERGTLFELAFRITDADQARQYLQRISPGEIRDFEARDLLNPVAFAAWRRLGFENEFFSGVDIHLIQPLSPLPRSKAVADAPISRTDLVVVQTAQPERALGFFGTRLDLELVLDRTNPDTGNRLLQFVCGDMLVEVSHNPTTNTPGKPDTIWGIGWSVADAEATHRRLSDLGRSVSAVKDGAKPGTRVFTVRDGTCGIRTLVVQHIHTP